MLSNGLVADVYQDKMYFKGRAYPLGSFAIDILNDFYANDTGARFAVFSNSIFWLKRNLLAGFLIDEECEKVRDELYNFLLAAKRVKPFKMFDLDKEWEFLDSFLRAETHQGIKNFFKLRASYASNNDKAFYMIMKSVKDHQRKELEAGQQLLNKFYDVLDFYENLSSDYSTAFGMFREYAKCLNAIDKFDETSLASVVTEIGDEMFDNHVGPGARFIRTIQPKTEYLAIKKSALNKNLITARRIHCKRFIDFVLADFYEGICKGHYPKRCLVCKRYFLMQSARNQLYCNGRDPNDEKKRTCRQVAADRRRGIREKEDRDNNPIKYIYNRAAANIRQYEKRGKLSAKESKAAKRYIRNMQFRAMQDNEFFNSEYENRMSILTIIQKATR